MRQLTKSHPLAAGDLRLTCVVIAAVHDVGTPNSGESRFRSSEILKTRNVFEPMSEPAQHEMIERLMNTVHKNNIVIASLCFLRLILARSEHSKLPLIVSQECLQAK